MTEEIKNDSELPADLDMQDYMEDIETDDSDDSDDEFDPTSNE